MTVSPGLRLESDVFALRSIVVVDPTSTATRLPLDVVTYSVFPMMSVTVPDVIFANALVSALAPPERDPPRANGKAEAADEVDDDEWRCIYAPPQMPTDATNKTSRRAAYHGMRTPLAGPWVGLSSGSSTKRLSRSEDGSAGSGVETTGTCAVVSVRTSSVGGPLSTTSFDSDMGIAADLPRYSNLNASIGRSDAAR